MLGSKITKISIDEKNHKYSIQTENGKIATGFKALNRIRVRKVLGVANQEYLEPFLGPEKVKPDPLTNAPLANQS